MFQFKLNPLAQYTLLQINMGKLSSTELQPLETARKNYELFSLAYGGIPPTILEVETRYITNTNHHNKKLQVRIYTPTKRSQNILLYFHGGGWVIGSINSHDTLCRHLAKTANCIVVSAGYSLAPAHPFPTALNEAHLFFQWCLEYAKSLNAPHNVAIGGDSAGGNLAAALSAELTESNKRLPSFQLLLYPTLNMSLNQKSMIEYGEDLFLTKKTLEYYSQSYSQYHDTNSWRISPLNYPNKSKLPPAIILTSDYDPVKDDGYTFAYALNNVGIKAAHYNASKPYMVFCKCLLFFQQKQKRLFIGLGIQRGSFGLATKVKIIKKPHFMMVQKKNYANILKTHKQYFILYSFFHMIPMFMGS